jgi:arylsulfatase A-like enzyme
MGVVLTALQTASLAQSTRTPSRPNFVYILADDLGIGDVSCYNPQAAWRTTHMDRLAAEGLRFTDAHSGSAVCTPTRYGILTGRYAWRTRLARGVLDGTSRHLIGPGRLTVASFLRQNGYHTACIGKWHLGWDWAYQRDDPQQIDLTQPVTHGPLACGFDDAYCLSASLDMPPYVYLQNDRVTAPPNRTTVNPDYQAFWREGLTGKDFDHREVLPNFTQRAVEYIRQRGTAKEPFFLYLALPAPHTPILPTDEFVGKSGTNPYGDFTLQVDDSVGRVVQAIGEAGLAEQTCVIVTSDNGCSPRARFEELARFGHHPSYIYRGHKADIYEGGHRIPLIVRWPGHVRPGGQTDETVCLTDLLRTCADILGQSLPDDAGEDSVSLLSVLEGRQEGVPPRASTVHHSINGSFAIRAGKWKLALCPGSGGWSEPRPEVAARQQLPPVQLFDLEADPGETNNRASEFPEVVERLRALLAEQVRVGRSTPGAPQTNDREVLLRAAGTR